MTEARALSDKDRLRARVLVDTGVLCRELLGFNYDEDASGRKINVGTGGIRDSGKTREIIALLDDHATKYKMVVAPRESRKSSMLIGFIIRQILLWPDIRIFYVARTDDMARAKCQAIRALLASERVTEMFGAQEGDVWTDTEFNVRGRVQAGQQNSTFTAFSQDSMPTGGRANLLIVDDFIDDKNVTNAVQNRKSKSLYATLQPFMAHGGTQVYAATIWADDDLTNDLMGNPLFAPPYGGQVVCGAGVRVITTEKGTFDLEVLPAGLTFPHLTLDHLRQKLWGMTLEGKFDHFVRQYLNETGSTSDSHFQRRYFQPLAWGEDMRQLSGYLVTDAAGVDAKEELANCYGVVAYVGIDASDNLYLLDLRVGRPDPTEFCNWVFEMLEEWMPKVNHCGECWEDVAISNAYRHQVKLDARARKIRLNIIEMRRPPQSQKLGRINRLQPVMKQGRFYVVSTVPRTFMDLTGEKLLWDPQGHFDGRTKERLPAGELVDEFIKQTGRKDIPDALAMVLEDEKTRSGHRRLCRYKPYRPPDPSRSLTLQRQELYHAEHYGSQSDREDWWDKTLREQGF